jgi:hypothetical protein
MDDVMLYCSYGVKHQIRFGQGLGRLFSFFMSFRIEHFNSFQCV